MKHILPILLISIILSMCISCTIDKDKAPAPPGDGKLAITFDLETPPPTTIPTRASGYTDTDIKNVDVLVFKANGTNSVGTALFEIAKSDLISTVGDLKSFTIRVDPSTYELMFFVIANARDPETGAYRIPALADPASLMGRSLHNLYNILTSNELQGDPINEIMPLLMQGVTYMPGGPIDNNTKIGATMTRMVSCIQIETAAPTPDNGLADFTVLRTTLSRVAPLTYLHTGMITTKAGINYWKNAADEAGWRSGSLPLYCYKTPYYNSGNHLTKNGISLLVHARWNGQEYYYPIGIYRPTSLPDDAPSDERIYLQVNTRYIVKINAVMASGYPTPEEAMAGTLTNVPLDATITATENINNQVHDIVWGGKHYLGVSNTAYEGWGNPVIKQQPGATPGTSAWRHWKVGRATSNTGRIKFTSSNESENMQFHTGGSPSGADLELVVQGVAPDLVQDCSATVRVENLSHEIDIRFFLEKLAIAPAGGYYTVLVADETTPKPWKVWIPYNMGVTRMGLTVDGNPSSASKFKEITSRMAGRAYVHVRSTQNCVGDLFHFSDGTGKVTRIQIMGYGNYQIR